MAIGSSFLLFKGEVDYKGLNSSIRRLFNQIWQFSGQVNSYLHFYDNLTHLTSIPSFGHKLFLFSWLISNFIYELFLYSSGDLK